MSGTSTPVAPSLMDCLELDAVVWNELGPGLRKLYGLEAVASDPGLTGIDKGVFTWIASHADDLMATAYPSVATLARLLVCARRSVVYAVARLERAGYLVVLERGRPGRSSRYRLTFKGARRMKAWKQACSERGARGDAADTMTPPCMVQAPSQHGASHCTMTPPSIVQASSQHGANPGMHMVQAIAPEATQQAAYQGGLDGGWLPSTASPSTAAVGDAPGGAPPSASNGQIQNAWFFSVYPKRVNVAKADRLLTDMLRDGVVAQEALAAASLAYARYVQAKHWPDDKYVIAPCNFLRDHRWQDDWTVQDKPATPAAKTKKRKPAKGAAKTAAKTAAPKQAAPKQAAQQPQQKRASAPARVEAEQARIEAVNAKQAKNNAAYEQSVKEGRERQERVAAAAAEAAVAKAAAAADARAREQQEREREAVRCAEVLQEFRRIRPSLLAMFDPRDVEEGDFGFIGSRLTYEIQDTDRRLKHFDMVNDQQTIGRAICNAPRDEDCFRRVFEDARLHDAELLLNAAKSYMSQWTASRASRAAEDSKAAGPKRVGLALVTRADEGTE